MSNSHFLQKLQKLSQQKQAKLTKKEESLSFEDLLAKGQALLFHEDNKGITLLEKAALIHPEDFKAIFHIALAFLEEGTSKEDKKLLLLALKYMKKAHHIDSQNFEHLWTYGSLLHTLGLIANQNDFFISAKEKFKKALILSNDQPKKNLFELYWDLGNTQLQIAAHSGEAIDVKNAIEAFQSSLENQKNPPSDFWIDYGSSYLQMGLLINDSRLFLQAISYYKKALESNIASPSIAHASIAEAYRELYLNTADENYFQESDSSYALATKADVEDENLLLEWSQILCESGKLNRDPKKLRLSYEKALMANKIKSTPSIIAQICESLSLLGLHTNRLQYITQAENRIKKALAKFPCSPDLFYAYGSTMQAFCQYYDDLDYEELAIEQFQKGISLDRTNAEIWHALGNSHSHIGIECEDEKILKRACKFFLRAMDLKPHCPPLYFDYAKSLVKLGEITEDVHKVQEALGYFQTTLGSQNEKVLEHPEYLFYYGHTLHLLGNIYSEKESFYQQALEIYNQVMLIDPNYPKIHLNIALCYTHLGEIVDRKYFNKAINAFRLSAKHDEEDDILWLEWGLSLISLAQHVDEKETKSILFLDAERKIRKAGTLGNMHAYYHLACLYSLIKQHTKALSFLEKAYSLDVLPDTDDLMQDDWLEDFRSTELFREFLQKIEKAHSIKKGL